MKADRYLTLIVESAEDGNMWGRVSYRGNLITGFASSMEELQKKMKKLLFDFDGVKDVKFEIAYDLTHFFDFFSYLKISKIAELAGMNPSLLRHYAAGSKAASKEQVARIEMAVHQLGQQMTTLKLIEHGADMTITEDFRGFDPVLNPN